MVQFQPELLAAWTGGRWTARPSAPPTGFANDTRRMRAGEAFVALKTGRRDGRDFLGAARDAGAVAAVVAAADPSVGLPQLVVADPLSAFQAAAHGQRRLFGGPVVAISGSAGKTSTKELLALLLGGEPATGASPVLATAGNLNNQIGVPLTLTRLDPAVHLRAVIEAGVGAPGEMAPLAAMIEPDIAIITLVAPAHLDGFGSLERVACEKALLAAAIRPGGVAIFPEACAGLPGFRELRVPVLLVGRMGEGSAADGPPGAARVSFSTVHRGGETTVAFAGRQPADAFSLPRVSDGMAQNAALAVCAARRLGVSDDAIRSRLARWRPAPLRGEMRRTDGRLLYLDCYNANPAAMADAISAFHSVAPPAQPRIFVLGGMEELGAEAARYHRELGRVLHLRAGDFLFIIGPHADAVRAGAIENGNLAGQISVVDSLQPVADRLSSFSGAVFAKGSRKYALETLFDAAAAAHA